MAPPLPPGFVLDRQMPPKDVPVAPLPPGFVLDKAAAPAPVAPPAGLTPGSKEYATWALEQARAGNDLPLVSEHDFSTPVQPPAEVPFFNPESALRSLQIGTEDVGRGVADAAGAIPDLANAGANLGMMGIDGLLDLLKNPAGMNADFRFGPSPIGSDSLFNNIVAPIIPGETITPDQMTPEQRIAGQTIRMATGALLPGAALAAPTTRAAAVASDIPIFEALTRPYTKGATPVSDAIAGAGAGGGLGLYDEYTPEPVKEALGPVGDMLAMFGGAIAGNITENVARFVPGMVGSGIRNATVGPKLATDIPARKGDGSYFTQKDADNAARFVQGQSLTPGATADRVSAGANYAREFASEGAIPTVGPLSGDPGLIALEKGARQSPDYFNQFAARDQAVERAALENANKIAPETAVGRMFTDAVDTNNQQRVDAAQAKVNWTTAHRDAVAGDAASEAALLEMARGGEVPASQSLDQVLAQRLVDAQKAKNDAFAAIDPAGTEYRDPTDLLNAADEIKMNTGPLADPAGVPSGWIDRIRGLVDENGNVSQVSFKDLNAIRPQLSEQITAARKAGNYTLADNLSRIKGVIDTETDRLAAQGGDAGVRAKSALAEYAKFAETWARGGGDEAARFRKDFNLDRNNRTYTPPSDTAARFIRPADPERAAALKRIIKDDPKGNAAVGDFLMADLAKAGVTKGGRINPEAVRKWAAKWGDDALNLSPEFKKNLDQLLEKADISANDTSILAKQLKDAETDLAKAEADTAALRTVLGKDPVNAVNSLFNSADPERAVREVLDRVKTNSQAKDGFKAAVREYLREKATTAGISRTGTGENPLSFAKLDKMFKEQERVLAEVFSPDEMNYLRASHKFLADLENLKMQTVPGSQTSTNQQLWDRFQRPLEVALKARFGILKGGGLMRTINLWRTMLPTGDEAVAELIGKMYFDPELAAHLLTRNVSEVGSAKYNNKLITLLSAGQVAGDMLEPNVEK